MNFLFSAQSYDSMSSTMSLVTMTKSYCGPLSVISSRHWGTICCVCVCLCVLPHPFPFILGKFQYQSSSAILCLAFLMSIFFCFLFSSSATSLPDRIWRKIHIIGKWQDLEPCDGALFFPVSTFPFSSMLWNLISIPVIASQETDE